MSNSRPASSPIPNPVTRPPGKAATITPADRRWQQLISVLELMLAVVQRAVDVEEALTGRVQRLDERVTMLAREGGASQPPPLQRT